MQASLWTGCAVALGVAGIAAVAERRRNNRTNLDRVGFMPWPLILIGAMIVAAVLAAVALKV